MNLAAVKSHARLRKAIAVQGPWNVFSVSGRFVHRRMPGQKTEGYFYVLSFHVKILCFNTENCISWERWIVRQLYFQIINHVYTYLYLFIIMFSWVSFLRLSHHTQIMGPETRYKKRVLNYTESTSWTI
jgi:hypothetical protein